MSDLKIVLADVEKLTSAELAKHLAITIAEAERIKRHVPRKGDETDGNRTVAP